MSQILDDIRNVFRRKDDTLAQLLVVNMAVFVLINFVKVGLFLLGLDAVTKEAFASGMFRQLAISAWLPQLLTHPWTLLTYFVSHENFFHLFFNLLFLYWFGQLIQEYLGSVRLLVLYVLGGLAGGAAYVLAYNTIPVFEASVEGSQMIGASGAVYGVVVGAATLLPNYTFNLLFIGTVRIVYIAAAYVLLSFFEISGGNPGGNIAHLGGALMGYVYITQLRQGRDLGAPIAYVVNSLRNLRLRRQKRTISPASRNRSYETVASAPANRTKANQPAPAKTAAEVRQEEVDAILDKMLVSGYNSLTIEEKRKLDAAGQSGN